MSGTEALKKLPKIPVFIGEGHYEVAKFIHRHIDSQNLPRHGNIIVKLDNLPDEVIPKEMLNRNNLDPPSAKKYLYSDIGMHDWIFRLADSGKVGHVVWIKPPWSKIAEDGSGVRTIDKSNNPISVKVDIKTVGKNMFENQPDDYQGLSEIISACVTADTPWILDIDLSFFSSINPFISLYKKANAYPILEELFAYPMPENNSSEEIKRALQNREEQLKELQEIFMYLEEHRTLPAAASEPSERYKLIQKMKEQIDAHFEDHHIDWKHLFDAGCVSNSFQLPVHYTEREKVLEILDDTFSKILDSFPCPPTVITIARSSEYDVFVPIKDCNFIEQNLVKTLKKKLTIDQPEMPYLDM